MNVFKFCADIMFNTSEDDRKVFFEKDVNS